VCGAGVCVATGTEIDPLIIEVVPPASSHFGAGDSFLVQLDDPSDRSRSTARDIKLLRYASVNARLIFEPEIWNDESLPEECLAIKGADYSVGVHVALTRSEKPVGLPVWSSVATAKEVDSVWEFQLSVPADTYDLYLTPLNGCRFLPPVWFRGVKLTEGKYTFPALKVPSLATLSYSIKPPIVAIDDWSIQLIDPAQGLPLSTSARSTGFPLYYVPLGEGLVPLIRVAPPEGVVAPTILWDLSVADFDNDGKVGLDLSSLTWSVTTVRARVEKSSPSQGLAGATVTLRSTHLEGAPEGLTASWETTVKSGTDGDFEVQLVPGDYQVIVTPGDSSDAVSIQSWTVAAEPAVQHGRVLSVQPATRMTGVALEPRQSSPIARSEVEVVPISQAPSLWERALGAAAVAPRSASGQTSSTGEFSVPVDAGKLALLIRTPEESGFPWLMHTGISIDADAGPVWELGGLHATYPIVVSGKLTDPDGNLVQLARLRAFALVGADGSTLRDSKTAKGAIQVAETRSGNDGRFRLMLPASLR